MGSPLYSVDFQAFGPPDTLGIGKPILNEAFDGIMVTTIYHNNFLRRFD